MVIEFTALTGRRGNRADLRGKSGLHRAACRVTPGESNLKDSVTEKKTAFLSGQWTVFSGQEKGKDEKAG